MRIDPGFAEEIVSKAKRMGADQAEVYLRSSRNLTVEVKAQSLDALKSSRSFGYSLRVIRANRLGFSYSTEIGDADAVIRQAIESSQYPDADPYLGLPEQGGLSKVGVADPVLENYSEDDAIRNVLRIEKAAFAEDGRIKKARKVSGTFSSSETAIVNSESVRSCYPSTSCSAQITVIAESGADSQVGWEYEGSRFLEGVSFEEIGKSAARRAVSLLGARTITGQKAQVLLDNSVAVEFLEILASSFSSEAVQKGKSLLAGRKGRKVVSEKINLIDSGILSGRLGSSPADAEGVATGEKILVSDGVLREYLHNTYTARKDGARSTGNAARGGFSSLPFVGVTNFFLDASSSSHVISREGLVPAIDKGLYVIDAMGVHTANPISGEFSVGVTGLWIENGKIRHPVKEAVMSGSVLELFQGIEAIGNDLKFYGSVGAPSFIISGVDISG